MTWLLETLVWTGAMIALVLALRRPVARHFGAKAAYALWLLPLARLMLPPIVLPAWLAGDAESSGPSGDVIVLLPADQASTAVTDAPVDWFAWIVAIWLVGALVYVAQRLGSYHRLRGELLAGARAVGEAGRIRLVETPATASPLAFGVLDKVIALPPGFMAWPDRKARDLALAHELAHHRAHDLAVNFMALPLFALHWFNPLSWLGWQAMRRDQEAACDARVIEHCDRADRVAYAVLIAGTVAGPRGALAAPMACPVLGDKSIVHRLRNLTMTTQSNTRRRAGMLLVGAGALLLPLTASISYAQDDTGAPPPPSAPAAPLPPEAPAAPLPPAAPLAPEADGDVVVLRDGNGKQERGVVMIRSHGDHAGETSDGAKREVRRELRVIHPGAHGEFDTKALEKQMSELGEHLGNLKHLDRVLVIDRERLAKLDGKALRMAPIAPMVPRIEMKCDGKNAVSEATSAEGQRVIRICRNFAPAQAAFGLRAARAQVAAQTQMNEETRQQVLRSLDGEIARLEAEKDSSGN